LLAFLVLPYLFFAPGTNVLKVALAPGDGMVQGFPTKIYSTQLQLWSPYTQAGTFPFKDLDSQSSYLPGIIVMKLFPNPFGYNLLLLLHYSIAGFFTYLFLKKLGLQQVAALLGGLIFMFCGFLTAHKSHHSMLMAAAYLPVLLYLLEEYLTTGRQSWLFLGALAFGLGILAEHPQISVYTGMLSFPYLVFRVLGGPEFAGKPLVRKLIAIAGIAGVVYLLGVLVAAVEIIPVIESLKYLTREEISYPFFGTFSFPLRLWRLVFFPFFYGTQYPNLYSGSYSGAWNLTEMAGYMGILPLLFAALAFAFYRGRNKQVYFWMAVALTGLLLVLGSSTPFYRLMYHVPIYNLFRASARNWLEVNFAVAVLSAFFISHLAGGEQLPGRRYYRGAHAASAALLLVVFIALGMGKSLVQSVQAGRLVLPAVRLDSPAIFIPLIIIAVSIALLYLAYRFRQSRAFWMVTGLVLFLDLFSFGHFHDTKYPHYKVFENQPNPVAGFLEAQAPQKDEYRLYPLEMVDYEEQLYPSLNVLYGFSTMNGYGPIWMKDYAALTGIGPSGLGNKYGLLSNSRVLSLLSTRYIITSDPADHALLEGILASGGPGEAETIVEGFGDRRWRFSAQAARKSESVLLSVRGSTAISLVKFPFRLSPEGVYKLSFSARMPRKVNSDAPLMVEFAAGGKSEHETLIEAPQISGEFQPYTIYLLPGESLPRAAEIRFYTSSRAPYEIKDVRLERSQGVAYWGSPEAAPGAFPLYALRFESPEGIRAYENLNFLPRARFVTNVMAVKDAQEAIERLWHAEDLDPATTALVEEYEGTPAVQAGSVLEADYSRSEAVRLSVQTGERSFLVLADSWYPGWKVSVDGRETRMYKTDAALRGVLIEGAGVHEVEFRFVPISLYAGLAISVCAVMVILFFVIRKEYTKSTN
jgi:hypothetical protein